MKCPMVIIIVKSIINLSLLYQQDVFAHAKDSKTKPLPFDNGIHLLYFWEFFSN